MSSNSSSSSSIPASLVGQDLHTLWGDVPVRVAGGGGDSSEWDLAQLLRGRVALFSVPAAFSPTCSERHIPGVVASAQAMLDKGVDTIVCLSCNDVFVMRAWWKELGADPKLHMLCDGDAALVKQLGLSMEIPGMGTRAQRFAMLVDKGIIQHVAVDPPGTLQDSTAEAILAKL